MKISKEILEKFRVGDGLTDNELHDLLEFYTNLEESLRILGDHYYVAWLPVFHDKLSLEYFFENRKRGK